jgi:exonuclease VII large subunit
MPRTILIAADEPIACPKCTHPFALSEGISRQAIERHAEDYERGLAERRRSLEAELAAEAKRHAEGEFETRLKALNEALAAKESSLSKFRSAELELRRQLRELDEAKKNLDLDYSRKLDAERKHIEAQARAAAGEDLARREAQWKAQLDSAQREAAT